MLQRLRTLRTTLATALVICIFFVLNFYAGRVFHGEFHWSKYFFFGILVAQCNLIAIWSAIAPVNIVVRLSWTVLFVALIWDSWILESWMLYDPTRGSRLSKSLQLPFFLGIVLLAGVVSAQIPMWIAGQVFHWRLDRNQPGVNEGAKRAGRQFRLQHLLLAVFLVSLAIAPLHIVVPRVKDALSFAGLDNFLMNVAVLFVCNLVFTVPSIWGAFLRTRVMLIAGAGWLLYCLLLSWGERAIFQALNSGWTPALTVPRLYALNLSQCITVVGTLLIFRALGFRLVRDEKKTAENGGKRRGPPSQVESG